MSSKPATYVSLSGIPRETSPTELAARCQNAQPDASHESFCFELFRRAIVQECTLCWHYLRNHYYRLVRYWICQLASLDADTVDDLVQDALAAFWRFYIPDKLGRAKGLADILAYLKSCAASAVAQKHRQASRAPQEVEWNEQILDDHLSSPPAEASVSQWLEAQDLWTAVDSHCNDERDHLVAQLIFLADLKPRHIARQYPDLFPDVSDVYRVKRNLMDRLRRSPTLRSIRENW